jgi:hypothetical protein
MSKFPPNYLRRYSRSLTLWLLVAALATVAFSSTSAAKLVGRWLEDKSHHASPVEKSRAHAPDINYRPAMATTTVAFSSSDEQSATSAAFVTTDQTDYQPGETVVIFGSGWMAGEQVTLSIHEESGAHADALLAAEADEYGIILNKEFAPTEEHRGAAFTLTATGQASARTANAKFTDGGIMSYAPNSVSLTAFSGASSSTSTSFTQTVTAPSGNGNFQAPAQVISVSVGGSLPMPASWVTVTGGTGNFATGNAGNPKNPPDFKTRNVSVTPAANTAPGIYSAILTSAPTNNTVGAGQGTVIQLTVTADNAPPTTTLSAIDSNNNPYNGVNFTNANKVEITLNAADAGGSGIQVTRYKIESAPFKNYTAPFDIASEGLSVVTYFSVDNTGAQETAHFFTVKIDKTAPAVNCDSADGIWHASDVSIPCSAVDGGGQQKSGLASPADANFTLSTSVPAGTEDANASTDSRNVCDNAGNCAAAGAVTGNMVDKKAPAANCGAADGLWHDADVSIPCTASDGGSGLANASDASFNLSTDTAADTEDNNVSTDSRQVCDGVNNCTTAGAVSGNMIDKKAPQITASAALADSSPYTSGDWVNQDVIVSYQCTDGGSGVAGVDSPVTISSEGANQSATGDCTDNVGHTSQADFSGINIDKTKPTLSFDSYSPAANGAGWNNTDVSVAFTASDALSGVANTSPASSPLALSAEGASVTGSVTVTDVAGNSDTFNTSAVKIDKTKPALNPSRHAGSEPNGAGWNNSAVTVDANASDALSGLASVSPASSQTASGEGAGQSLSFTATDVAGNSETASLGGINIDLTKPVINASRTPAANAFGWNNTDVIANYTASDALSGLVESPTGSHTFNTEGVNQSHTFTVHDVAGNSNDASVGNVNIDKTAPVVTINSPVNGSYLLNQTVAANYSCSDTGAVQSGIDGCAGTVASGSNIDTGTVGAHTFSVNATDKAGNSASGSRNYGVIYDWSDFLQPVNVDGSSVFKLGSTVPVKFRLTNGSAGVVGATNFKLYVAKVSNNTVGTEIEAVTSTPASTGNLFRYDPSGGIYIYNMGTKGVPWSAGTWQLRVDLGDGALNRIVLISLKP